MNVIDSDSRIAHAINEISSTYGASVSVSQKAKSLIKFGRNDAVGTSSGGYTIWATGADQPNETYVAANTNSIDSISSASSETQTLTIEGHTESGGNKTFISQNVTLTGTTRKALTTSLNRVTRAYNTSSTGLAGPVYIYENTTISTGKPTDTTKIHLTIPAGANQSRKASTSLSSVDYWLITSFYADVLSKTAAYADISLQIRPYGGVFRTTATISASNNHQGIFPDNGPCIIAPANSDIRLLAVGSGTISVSGGVMGFLAKVRS